MYQHAILCIRDIETVSNTWIQRGIKLNMKTCAFTGQCPQSFSFGFNEEDESCINLKKARREQILSLIENKGAAHFISGMAIGTDVYAARNCAGIKSLLSGKHA